jgi:hypothetical protein
VKRCPETPVDGVPRHHNFVFDPTQTPHATADQLSEWFGVQKTTMANKARLVRDTLKLSHLDGEVMRRDLVDASLDLATGGRRNTCRHPAGPHEPFNSRPSSSG